MTLRTRVFHYCYCLVYSTVACCLKAGIVESDRKLIFGQERPLLVNG
jgi:hypothetical protein